MIDINICHGIRMCSRIPGIAVFTILICGLTTPATASQFSVAPVQLSFTGYPPGMQFGWSSALTADGNVAVLGGPGSSSNPGGAVLYTQSGGIWSDPIFLSMSSIPNGVQAGIAVGVTPDGSQAFVGVPDINNYTGAVYVYTESSGSWNNTPVRSILALPTGIPAKSSFGDSIATSADGQTLVVGAAAPASGGTMPGAVYVYTLSGGSWGSPVALSNAGIGNGAGLGASVAVSSNGQVVVAGAPNGSGATAYVYTETNGAWSGPVALSMPSGASSNGYSVAISVDGKEILTGAPFSNSGAGAAYLYSFNNSNWNLAHTFTAANSGALGWCVGLSPDGTLAFFGNFTGNSGSIYASANNNGSWSAPAALSVTGVNYGDFLGFSLAVGQNGQMVLGGAVGANANAGGGFVYESPAAISLSVSPSTNPVAPGSNVTFNLTVTNADQPSTFPATTLTNVVLTDTLPNGTSYVSSNAANGTCTDSGGAVTCTLASLSPGNNSQNPWSPSITVKAPGSAGTLTNTLSVTADQPLHGTTNTSTTLTVSSSSNSGSSGKSGGGAVSIATLLMLISLLSLTYIKRTGNAYRLLHIWDPMQITTMFNLQRVQSIPADFRKFIRTAIVVAVGFMSVSAMAAQFTTAPVQLSMSGVNISYFGYATALSSNGQEALVGGGGCESTAAPSGAFIYTRAGGTWGNPVQLSENGVPSGNSFGCAVALSANGQVALVGSSLSNTAYVFTKTNGTWSAPVKLSLTGITPSEFGFSVALSPDGQTALVGDDGANSGAGAVYVYTYNGSSWGTGTSLTPSGLSNALYGYSIAVSSDGSTGLVALIGATETGKVYVSRYNGSSWSTPTAVSTSGIPSTSGSFGASVALSANGQSAVVGSPFENGGVGAAYVYTGTGGSFGNPTALTFPVNTTVRGFAVAMAPNGQEAFAGAPLGSTSSTNAGTILAYRYNGSSWSSPVTLSTQGFQSQGGAGWSLAEGASGQELLVGAPFANANAGLGYIYESPTAVTASVTPTPSQVVPGKNVELDISFTNADTAGGGLPAVNLSNLVLTDTLPAGSTYVSSNAANGNCSHTSTTVTCTLATLNAGSNSQNPWQPSITITTPSTAGKITNSLSVTADEPLTGLGSVTTPITNDVAPTVTSGNVTTPVGTAVSGTLQATPGFSGQALTFAVVTQPSHGSVALTNTNTGTFTYTPASGYTGTDLFIFTAGDGTVTSAPGGEAIAVGISDSGGSSSSGKSGGGAMGFPALLALSGLLALMGSMRKYHGKRHAD
jgi:uncharacterized repeat protein (TIGR01451 family)